MKFRWMLMLVFLLPGIVWAQSRYTIPLRKENPSLSLPSMAARDGVLYVAYRSFGLLRFSSQLQVVAYDLRSHKELKQVTIAVPEVHGARAAQGFFLSKDGKELAYSEAYSPTLLLLLATRDLSVIRRSNALPFTPGDLGRQFFGFDSRNLLAFASVKSDKLRFIRISPTDLKPVSDLTMKGPEILEPYSIVWSPSEKLTWIDSASDKWQEYTEAGRATGQALRYRGGVSYGAIALGEGKLLAFYGNMVAMGTVATYNHHHTSELKIKCAPRPYGISNDPEYAGVICPTMTDLAEPAKNKILTSSFLLLQTKEPAVVWRSRMSWLGVANGNGPNEGFQKGDPLIHRSGKSVWVIAPTKSPELAVYQIAVAGDYGVPKATPR